MKKSLLALAALASIASVAHAEDGVQLYGIIDEGFGTLQHSLNGGSQFPGTVDPVDQVNKGQPGTFTGMLGGAVSDSRWGIKGSEDLGQGRKFFFTLESGIDVNTGTLNNGAASLGANAVYGSSEAAATSLNGQLFNRQAFGGFSDPKLGSIQFGRNYTHMFDIFTSYDPVQDAQLFSPFGFSGTLGGGGGATESMRSDNSIKYNNKMNYMGGTVNYGVLYHSGNTSYQGGNGFDANLGFENARFGIQADYSYFTNVEHAGFTNSVEPGAGLTTTVQNPYSSNQIINVTNQNDIAYLVAAKYKLTPTLVLKAGYQWFQAQTPSNQLNNTNVGDYYGLQANVTNHGSTPTTYGIPYVGGTYNFSDRLELDAGYYDVQIRNNGSNLSGELRFYSALLDYHITKRTDVYVGDMFSSIGGAAETSYYSTQNILATGFRHKF